MKKIVSLFLLCACCFSLFSCSLLIEDEKTEWQTSFILGAIDANGNMSYSESSIRTVKAIPCDGIRLVPDLWFSLEYRFFFYDAAGNFIGHTPTMTRTSDAKIPTNAFYAHIVLTPFDENGRPFLSIEPLDVVDYAEKVTVEINKRQKYNLYDEGSVELGKSFRNSSSNAYDWNIDVLKEWENAKVSNKVSLNGNYDKVDVYFKINENVDVNIDILVSDENGKTVKSFYADATDGKTYAIDAWQCITIDIAEISDAAFLRLVVPEKADVQIYAYND